MKKFIVFASILFAFIVIIPFIFAFSNKNDLQFLQVSNLDIAKAEDIVKVLKNNNIIEVSLQDFIVGSIAGEISPKENDEAIRAQAVAIYSLLLYRKESASYVKSHNGADICADSSHCLLYLAKDEIYNKWGRDGFSSSYNKLNEIVSSVKYKAVCYEGTPINSIFFAISSGKTLSCLAAFGEDLPYLQTIDSIYDETASGYLSTIKISKKDAHKKLNEIDSNIVLNNDKNAFANLELTTSGNVQNVVLGDKKIQGNQIRKAFSLRSTAFTVKSEKKYYIFTVKGYGHNVGMSQFGAIKMAERGSCYQDILKHYYQNTEIIEIKP